MGLRELVQRTTVWIGLDNYASILSDPTFWAVAIRTLGFTAFNVALTMILGTLVALLLGALGRWMRLALSISLILAWATPALTSTCGRMVGDPRSSWRAASSEPRRR